MVGHLGLMQGRETISKMGCNNYKKKVVHEITKGKLRGCGVCWFDALMYSRKSYFFLNQFCGGTPVVGWDLFDYAVSMEMWLTQVWVGPFFFIFKQI